MAQWPNGPMAQWPNGPMAQWPNGQWHGSDCFVFLRVVCIFFIFLFYLTHSNYLLLIFCFYFPWPTLHPAG